MKAGVIGLIDGDFERLESNYHTREEEGDELSDSIQIEKIKQIGTGDILHFGEAATQEFETNAQVDIDSFGEITTSTATTQVTHHTEFVCAPGEFVAVSSGNGTFAFDLIERTVLDDISVNRCELDLTRFAEDHYTKSAIDPWLVGFYGSGAGAEKGTVYGDNVFDDEEIGELLNRSQLNQLGMTWDRDGTTLNLSMTESGYVQVYQPNDFGRAEFSEFLLNAITPYATWPS